MSRYTTEVRFICEQAIGLNKSLQRPSVNDIIAQAYEVIIAPMSFPIFDNEYKPLIGKKILKHFYAREIGLETVGLWKLKLETKLDEIMPLYNQYYKSALLEFNPLWDTDLTRTYNLKKNDKTDNTKTFEQNENTNRDTEGESKRDTNASGTAHNLNAFSDTPQGDLNGIISKDYLTNATEDTGENSSQGNENSDYSENVNEKHANSYTDILNGKFTANDKYLERLTGKSSGNSFSELIEEFRKTFLNIDMMVIQELEPLFMQIW